MLKNDLFSRFSIEGNPLWNGEENLWGQLKKSRMTLYALVVRFRSREWSWKGRVSFASTDALQHQDRRARTKRESRMANWHDRLLCTRAERTRGEFACASSRPEIVSSVSPDLRHRRRCDVPSTGAIVLARPAAAALPYGMHSCLFSPMRDDWFFKGKIKAHDRRNILSSYLPPLHPRLRGPRGEVYCRPFYRIADLEDSPYCGGRISSRLLTTTIPRDPAKLSQLGVQ